MRLAPSRYARTGPRAGRGLAIAQFLACAVLAGTLAVGTRISNRELAPFWGAGSRVIVSALLLLAVLMILRLPLPRGRLLVGAMIFGALNFGGNMGLSYYGMVHVHAGVAALLFATAPLATLLLSVVQRNDRLRWVSVWGSVLAVLGVFLMTRAPLGGGVPASSVVAIVLAVVCLAQATVVVRRLPGLHVISLNAVGMATGGVVLLVASVTTGEKIAVPTLAETWVAMGYLVLAGCAVFVLYVRVIDGWGPSRAAYAFTLAPVVTICLSTWLDDEPLHAGLILGGVVVVAGVYIGALRAPRRAAPAPPVEARDLERT
jgi:drug/metabolite transporter (DMT)-like permease